jgi:transcriptional regulator with XRE-family HTH domain
MAEFKDRLKELREESGMTMRELAERIGTGHAIIQKYEHGMVLNPTQKTVKKLAKIFNVTPAYIVGYSDKR